MSYAIIVPTLNAGKMWPEWIRAVAACNVSPEDVYVIDSGSCDETVELALAQGFHVKQIEAESFNHGGTRLRAVTDAEGYELVIFLTQDAILYNSGSIANILAPFSDEHVAAVCGRQLPVVHATHIEAHARLFNYVTHSYTRTISDKQKYGLKSAFLSNSFAAYRVSVLSDVGGFPKNVIFGEDMYVAAKMLDAGYGVAYAADACVYHSHSYSLLQEMRRYFDMGVFHAREPWIIKMLGSAEGEGVRFMISEYKYLLDNAFWLIPEGVLRTVLRYSGFRLGLIERWLPVGLKIRMAMNKVFFK